MGTKARKIIYTLGAAILAVVVFLVSLVFVEKEESIILGTDSSSSSSSSSMQQQSSSGAGLGGGGGETGGGGGGASAPVLFKITTGITGRIYLRQDSKGDYTGIGEHGFVGDKKYYLENPTDINPLYYLGWAVDHSSASTRQSAQIELVELTNDLLPYGSISKSGAVNEKEYSVAYYPYDYATMGLQNVDSFAQISADYSMQEQAYRQFVEENYLKIPQSLKQTLLQLAQANGIYENSAYVVRNVVNYIRNAAYYDYGYANNDYPDDKDMVTYFLTEHKRGVCRHFAAAATMMFRALGIPARYTIGFAVDVEANVTLEYGDDIGEEGHAWTEIYIDGYGWVALEVTGGNMYTGGEIE